MFISHQPNYIIIAIYKSTDTMLPYNFDINKRDKSINLFRDKKTKLKFLRFVLFILSTILVLLIFGSLVITKGKKFFILPFWSYLT